MDLNVREKVAWIVGGGEGIGEVVALMFAGEGANIVISDIDIAKAQKVAAAAGSAGAKARAFQLDVRDGARVKQVGEEILATFGQIDMLAHIPGRGERKSFLETAIEDWDYVIKLNLYGPLNTIKAVVGHMVKRKTGKIVTVISDAGRVGEPRNCVYSAAKAGVSAFTKALAKEVGPSNINLNCVSLGLTHTPALLRTIQDFARGRDPKDYEERVLRQYPLRRVGEPEDIAAMICFLLSDRAKHITGQTISVDGGYCMV